MSLQVGQVLDGKYRIVKIIGEGGMGAVFEGEHTLIRRRVAIKVLHAGVASNVEMVQRFEREAQVAGTVGNDHILEILDLGALPSGERYMVMEFLDGETLTDRIKSRGRLKPAEASSLIRQVLKGLAAAHGAGIVHRDLKPDNVFILKEKAGIRDFVKIIDFGISKFSEQGTNARMTRTGTLMGTPHYMAPEQATGSAGVDSRTDIYAVGIILYEAVTGRVPFQAETFNQLLFEIALAKITPAREYVPDLDPAFDSIIMKASARDPGHRFQTSAEFAEALEQWEHSGRSVSVPPEQSIEAIVAATVPRTASAGGADAAVPLVRQTSGGTPAAAEGGQSKATVNSWANASQAGIPMQKGPPVLVATLAGVLLLGGGGFAAYRLLGAPPPAPEAPVAAAVAPPAPPPAPVQPATPPPAAAPTVAPAAAPAAPAVEPVAPAAPAVAPVASAAAAPAPAPAPVAAPAPKPVAVAPKKAAPRASTPPPPPADKPKAKKSFNFGY